ncbi:MAG: hypothetical protein PHU94_05460 [Bacilli bacterium]|nr:hypothetical protein [Bacilli bacterium]
MAGNYCGKGVKINMYSLEIECACDYGYVPDSRGCTKVIVPKNAHQCKSYSGWCCDDGYHNFLNNCNKITY